MMSETKNHRQVTNLKMRVEYSSMICAEQKMTYDKRVI